MIENRPIQRFEVARKNRFQRIDHLTFHNGQLSTMRQYANASTLRFINCHVSKNDTKMCVEVKYHKINYMGALTER